MEERNRQYSGNHQFRIGSIVVIKNGVAYGQHADTITKIVSKPGALTDNLFKLLGKRYLKDNYTMHNLILCQDVRITKNISNKRFRNLPVTYELLSDLRPATEIEKEIFRKLKY